MTSRKILLALVMVVALATGSYSQAAEEPKVKIRMQTHLIPTQTKRSMGTFAQDVAAASKGTLEVSIFPAGSIVPVKEMMDAVGKGTLDMALYPEGFWYKAIPVSEVGQGLPYSFINFDEVREFMFKKGFINLLREGYAKHNVYIIPYEPFSVGLMTKKPVNKVEDLKGMKLRAMGVMADFLGKLGASTTVVAAGELYTALATGVVDGAHWGDAGPMYEMKFQEVLKNYMEPEPIIGSWNNIMINLDLWKKLKPEQRAALESALQKCGMAGFNSSRALTKTAKEEMAKKWKVQFVNLPEAEQKKMDKVSEGMEMEMAKKDALSAKAINLLKELRKEKGR
ncbi:MAG: TRAP transporter substrate-binding protein DctP [Deltaproteobacteria bacterium]|nr:TRAP transporter substrate-binding protein DctP [Deltaproteobacteria bacterium]